MVLIRSTVVFALLLLTSSSAHAGTATERCKLVLSEFRDERGPASKISKRSPAANPLESALLSADAEAVKIALGQSKLKILPESEQSYVTTARLAQPDLYFRVASAFQMIGVADPSATGTTPSFR